MELIDTNAQILERVQSDRATSTKPEEDRRRRTIIVERKNDSFGFTLQSYGIHYKKEKEIEMITYVDFVDFDGPAYKAGMREGDVILSINGIDMEKADHKTLVNYIQSCESRMRMVVLFEDCVRKVELHMRYIKLQNILEAKMEELEHLCIRERQILEGKWKTHSLPARKKASQNLNGPPTPQGYYTSYRPTVSTEDVANVAQSNNKQRSTPPLVFAYQYLDSTYRYMIQPSSSGSGEYLLTFEPQRGRGKRDQGFMVKTPCENNSQPLTRSQQQKVKKGHSACHSYGGHLCNPCMKVKTNNGDNTSLEAYDLASPCCDPHCVPARRRSRSHKERQSRKRDSKTEETQTDPQPRSRPLSQANQTTEITTNHTYISAPRRYFHIGAGLVSQCSLHSCTSSELSNNAPVADGSNHSYTTSLSTDTLYWDGSCDNNSSRTTKNSSSNLRYSQISYKNAQEASQSCCNYPVSKPKSWDNLTTKAFGGYGFGYGYFDTVSSTKSTNSQKSSNHRTKSQTTQYVRADKTPQYTPHTQRRYFPPTKSTESLLSVPSKYEDLSDSSASCECLEANSPLPDTSDQSRFFPRNSRQTVLSPSDPNFGYYSASSRTSRGENHQNKNGGDHNSEATRL